MPSNGNVINTLSLRFSRVFKEYRRYFAPFQIWGGGLVFEFLVVLTILYPIGAAIGCLHIIHPQGLFRPGFVRARWRYFEPASPDTRQDNLSA